MMQVLTENIVDPVEKLKLLKEDRDQKIRAAEQASYAYFAECDVGDERCRAYDIYENVRCVTRV